MDAPDTTAIRPGSAMPSVSGRIRGTCPSRFAANVGSRPSPDRRAPPTAWIPALPISTWTGGRPEFTRISRAPARTEAGEERSSSTTSGLAPEIAARIRAAAAPPSGTLRQAVITRLPAAAGSRLAAAASPAEAPAMTTDFAEVGLAPRLTAGTRPQRNF
ncbi:hypothetical protein GCM10009639_06770 [Kitasatospora putterlickiae]|uniref:Uncharacterized protein n=1 Tax=Kitasatospora putterlickiae TaxID=221725 RepID=A0ABP4I9P8_9ACTN